MVDADRAIVGLIRAYAAARGLSASYASRLLTGSGDTVDRMVKRRMSLTARRAENIIQKASDHWPSGTPWPSDIPRPAPSAESAAREAASGKEAA